MEGSGVSLMLAAIRPSRLLFLFSLALSLGLSCAFIYYSRSGLIHGQRVWWLEDDAMVSMRYARNWASGLGLVWNPGERVEGFSNFLWTAAMAAVHRAGASDFRASLYVQGLELLCQLWVVWATWRLGAALGLKPWSAALASASMALSYNLIASTGSGMESNLFCALITEALAWMLQDPGNAAAFALVGLAGLVRADAFVFALAFAVLAELLPGCKLPRRKALLLLLGPSLLYEVFRLAYYGRWLPNTAYLKSGSWDGKFSMGLLYLINFFVTQFGGFSLGVLGAFRGPAKAEAWAALGLLAFFAAYACLNGGDYFDYMRFLLPVQPALLCLGLRGMERSLPGAAATTLAALVCFACSDHMLKNFRQSLIDEKGSAQERVEVGMLLAAPPSAGARLASAWAGSLYYFSHLRGVDMLGECDPVIAAEAPHAQDLVPGHNKYDFAYSLGQLKPDLLYSALRPESTSAQALAAYDVAMATDPLFCRHCLGHPVLLQQNAALYRCLWEKEKP
jgi:hypothetical protein